jgi:hypothetical protein
VRFCRTSPWRIYLTLCLVEECFETGRAAGAIPSGGLAFLNKMAREVSIDMPVGGAHGSRGIGRGGSVIQVTAYVLIRLHLHKIGSHELPMAESQRGKIMITCVSTDDSWRWRSKCCIIGQTRREPG